jgi:hypothetical protein
MRKFLVVLPVSNDDRKRLSRAVRGGVRKAMIVARFGA